jgi:hypothetical protein
MLASLPFYCMFAFPHQLSLEMARRARKQPTMPEFISDDSDSSEGSDAYVGSGLSRYVFCMYWNILSDLLTEVKESVILQI